MSTLAEILKKKKNPAAPLEERLKELINDFETIIKEGKKEIADAVKEAKKSALFDDSDPIEEKAVEAAQAEIFFFKQETQEKIESVVKRLDEKREKVQEEIKKLFEAHKEGLETLDAASEKVNALIEKLDSGLASATEAIANVSSTAKAKVEALKPRDPSRPGSPLSPLIDSPGSPLSPLIDSPGSPLGPGIFNSLASITVRYARRLLMVSLEHT